MFTVDEDRAGGVHGGAGLLGDAGAAPGAGAVGVGRGGVGDGRRRADRHATRLRRQIGPLPVAAADRPDRLARGLLRRLSVSVAVPGVVVVGAPPPTFPWRVHRWRCTSSTAAPRARRRSNRDVWCSVDEDVGADLVSALFVPSLLFPLPDLVECDLFIPPSLSLYQTWSNVTH